MGFKEWLNEEVDVASALKQKAENGLKIKTKFGTFKFDKMNKKKYIFVLDGEDKDVWVEVSPKSNETDLDVTVVVYKGDVVVGKKKSEKEEETEVQYKKLDVTKKVIKDIKTGIESILGSLNESEIVELDEDFGISLLAAALAPALILGIPDLSKKAVQDGWFGIGTDRETVVTTPEDIATKLKGMSVKKIQTLLKDESQVDDIVDSVVDAIKKQSPRFIVSPTTKEELYNKVLSSLRRIAEAKAKEPEVAPMGSIKDAAKEALAKSTGYKKNGVWIGKQV